MIKVPSYHNPGIFGCCPTHYRGALLPERGKLVFHRLELPGQRLHASFQLLLRGRCRERRRQAGAHGEENPADPLDGSRGTRSRTGA